jgi:lysine biosynthesis protein LysW
MAVAVCPACDEDVIVPGRVRLGQTVVCSRCGARLEIIALSPLELDWAFDEVDELEGDEDEDEDEFEELGSEDGDEETDDLDELEEEDDE